MNETVTKKSNNTHRNHRRYSTSYFGPIVMIAIGAYFLLNNLGYIGNVRWGAAIRLWPLLLVFLGINMIVRMAPRPFGSFLSLLVAVTAVASFGYVLLADDVPYVNQLENVDVNAQTEDISFAPDDVKSADIRLDFNSAGAEVFALSDSKDLISGQVSFFGDLIFKTEQNDGNAKVTLDTDSPNSFWLDPRTWDNGQQLDPWQIGLSPRVETDLQIDYHSGSVDLDLSALQLSDLVIYAGSGSADISLPDGKYEIEIDGSSGSIEIELPASMEARIKVDGGSGSFSLDETRFTQVEGDERDEGVWETAAYDDASDRVELILDVGSGSVQIR